MSSEPLSPWTTHSSKVIYENPWIRVIENEVTNPGGGPGIYGVVHFRHRAVGVIPISADGHTWLVGQYRYPTGTYEWEIPEGGATPEETLLECAERELLEEAGIRAASYELLLEMQTSNSVCDERAWIFVARDLSFGEAEPEETEELKLRKVPLEEAFRMARDGEIVDSLSLAGLLKLQLLQGGGQGISP